jgi:hypothetical protein
LCAVLLGHLEGKGYANAAALLSWA